MFRDKAGKLRTKNRIGAPAPSKWAGNVKSKTSGWSLASGRLQPHPAGESKSSKKNIPPVRRDATWCAKKKLLQLDRSAGGLQLGLDVVRFVLGNAFLDRAGSAVNKGFGFLQAERGDFPDNLDYFDLLLTSASEDDVELGLLFGFGSGGGSGSTAATATGAGGGYAEFLFKGLYELSKLKNGKGFYHLRSFW